MKTELQLAELRNHVVNAKFQLANDRIAELKLRVAELESWWPFVKAGSVSAAWEFYVANYPTLPTNDPERHAERDTIRVFLRRWEASRTAALRMNLGLSPGKEYAEW